MKALKRIVSIVITLAMAVSFMPSAFARYTIDPKGDFSLDVLGYVSKEAIAGGTKISDPGVTPLTSIPKLRAGDVIWVGYAITNGSRYKELAEGIFSTELAMDYDSRYLRPTNESASTSASDNSILKLLKETNIKTPEDTLESYQSSNDKWGEGYGFKESAMTYTAAMSTHATKRTPDIDSTNGKAVFISIENQKPYANEDGDEEPCLRAITSDESQYLIRIPFIVLADDIPSGTVALQAALGSDTIVFGLGESGESANSSSWDYNDKTTDAETVKNAANSLNYGGDPVLFPEYYSVIYNAVSDTGTGSFADSATTMTEYVAENGTPTLADTTGATYESMLTLPSGKQFTGWYTDAACQNAYTPAALTSDIVNESGEFNLYAGYEDAGYTITYDKNDDTISWTTDAVTEELVEPGKKATFNYTKDTVTDEIKNQLDMGTTGKTFAYWATRAENTDEATKDTTPYIYTKYENTAAVTESMTLYAVYQYTVEYDANGGTWSDPAQTTETVLVGDKATLKQTDGTTEISAQLTAPAATKEFAYWATRAEETPGSGTYTYTKYDNTAALTGTITLYAVYDDIKYNVTYHKTADDASWSAEAPTETLDGGEAVVKEAVVADQAPTYNVTLADTTTTKKVSDLITPPTGKMFKYWATKDAEGTYTEYTSTAGLTGDLELYAVYDDAATYTFDDNGAKDTAHEYKDDDGNGTYVKTITQVNGKDVDLSSVTGDNAPAIADHTFLGWFEKDANGAFTGEALTTLTAAAPGTTYYAKWKSDKADKTLTFAVNADAGKVVDKPDPESIKFTTNDTLQTAYGAMPSQPTRNDDYTFIGWYNNMSGDGEALKISDVFDTYLPTNGETLQYNVYARWDYNNTDDLENIIKVVFAKNADNYYGGTYKYTTIEDKYVKSGDAIGDAFPLSADMTSTETPQKNFIGWFTQENGKGDQVTSATAIDSSIDGYTQKTPAETFAGTVTLYPYWASDVTLTFVPNGGAAKDGETLPASLTIPYGGKVTDEGVKTAPLTDIPGAVKDGYKFKGWQYATYADGKYTPVTNADSTPKMLKLDDVFTESAYVVAVWETNIRVSFATDLPELLQPKGSDTLDPMAADISNTDLKPLVYEIWDGESTETEGDTTVDKYIDASTDLVISAAANYTYKYTADSDTNEPKNELTSVTAVDTYSTKLTWVGTDAANPADAFTTYNIVSGPAFKVVSSEVTVKVEEKYYAYADNLPETAVSDAKDNAAKYKVEMVSVTSTPVPAEVLVNQEDLSKNYYKTTFTKVGDPAVVFEDKYPNQYGEYTVAITAKDGSKYDIVFENSQNQGTFYLYPATKTINVSIGEGTAISALATGNVFAYTVTMSKYETTTPDGGEPTTTVTPATYGTDLVPGTVVKATIKDTGKIGATDMKDMPVEKTDFNAPANKKLAAEKAWLETDNTYQVPADLGTATEVTAETVFTPAHTTDPTYVIANYVDDNVTVTFTDTKADADKEADIVYTLTAGTAVQAGATDAGDNTKTDLPAPTAAPETMKFAGWYTAIQPETEGDPAAPPANGLKQAELNQLVTDGKTTLFAVDTPVRENITVYAVYVLNNDSSLKTFEMKEAPEKTPAAEVTYTDENYAAVDPAPTFAPENVYKPETGEVQYYTTVDKDTNYVQVIPVVSELGSTVEVKVGETVISSEVDGEGKAKGEYFVPVESAVNGSTNVIKITVTAPDGSKSEYVFNVKRFAQAGFKLNYGNSPYGIIMKEAAWDDAVKAAAKTAFLTNGYKFIAGSSETPTNAITNRIYSIVAWQSSLDSNVNMDLNDYALFVKTTGKFTDPGFTLTDNDGNSIVPDATHIITREIKYYRMTQSIPSLIDRFNTAVSEGLQSETTDLKGQADENIVTDLYQIPVMPGVYDMTYTYKDADGNVMKDSSGNDITITRPIVVLPNIGDIDINNVPNGNDANAINNRAKTPIPGESSSGIEKFGALYAYRVADVDNNSVVNGNDANAINNRAKTPMVEYYDFSE